MAIVEIDAQAFLDAPVAEELPRRERGAAEYEIVGQRACFESEAAERERSRPDAAKLGAFLIVGGERMDVRFDRPSPPRRRDREPLRRVAGRERCEQQGVQTAYDV